MEKDLCQLVPGLVKLLELQRSQYNSQYNLVVSSFALWPLGAFPWLSFICSIDHWRFQQIFYPSCPFPTLCNHTSKKDIWKYYIIDFHRVFWDCRISSLPKPWRVATLATKMYGRICSVAVVEGVAPPKVAARFFLYIQTVVVWDFWTINSMIKKHGFVPKISTNV